MKKYFPICAALVGAATFLAGCASPNYYGSQSTDPYPAVSRQYPQTSPQPYPQAYPSAYSNAYGTIDSIRVSQSAGPGSATGAVVGGLVGGLLGNQVGGGNGRTAATIAGVIQSPYYWSPFASPARCRPSSTPSY